MRLFATILLIGIFGSVAAQRDHLDKGDAFYKQRFYIEAIGEYKLALEENMVVNKYNMTQRVAATYKMLFDYENAELWYSKLVALGDENTAENYLNYANILCNNGKYDEAREYFVQYANKAGKTVGDYEQLALWAPSNLDSMWDMNVNKTNIETGSRSMGFWVAGNQLFYSKPVIDEFAKQTAFYDLAVAEMTDSVTFNAPQKIGDHTNRAFYEGTPFVSKDGNYMYYTANSSEVTKLRSKKKNGKKGVSKEGLNNLKIYRIKKSGSGWGQPLEMNFNSHEYSCAFPCLSADEKHLYFASNMEGGQGGFDLYRSSKINDSTWSAPKNLGATINTDQDEMYPFLNDTLLCYSSKGLPGYGGADVFMASINGLDFGTVQNMGIPVNSSKDDFSFVLQSQESGLLKGYLSSNREGVHGYDYIYHFSQKPAPIYPDTIYGIAMNKISLQPIEGVKVSLFKYMEEGKIQDDGRQTTNKRGDVTLILDKNIPYRVTFEKEDYKPVVIEIPATDRKDVVALFGRIEMQPIPRKNTVINIPNIYFDYNKSSIRKDSYPILDNIVKYLNENPTIRVELSAHTDARGSDDYNYKLSHRRAKSTVKYLIGKDISSSRLRYKGYGEKRIINRCKNGVECSDDEHIVNRRVEMKVL
jgi:outer membrane protein OmpA-like peptidoglycan-associated protein